MAIVTGNAMLQNIRGTLGGDLVFRQYGGRTVVAMKGAARKKNSVLQQLRCDLFKAAARHARVVLRDPVKREHYGILAKKLGKHSGYNLIISEYMRGGGIQVDSTHIETAPCERHQGGVFVRSGEVYSDALLPHGSMKIISHYDFFMYSSICIFLNTTDDTSKIERKIMNIPVGKTQKRKKQPSTEFSQKRSGVESKFQFEDNRPQAVSQRKLRVLADNSRQAMQLKAFQELADNSPRAKQAGQIYNTSKAIQRMQNNGPAVSPAGVIQRMYKLQGAEISENNKYAITNNLHILHVHDTAARPHPSGFFKKTGTAEIVVNQTFLDLADSNNPMNGSIVQEREPYHTYEPVVTMNDTREDQNPNDCGRYGRALLKNELAWTSQRLDKVGFGGDMIPKGEYDATKEDGGKERKIAGIGEMYRIETDDATLQQDPNGPKHSHHAATVIATDGGDQITSEAHSEKKITIPEFMMYGSTKENSFYGRHHKDYDRGKAGAYMSILALK